MPLLRSYLSSGKQMKNLLLSVVRHALRNMSNSKEAGSQFWFSCKINRSHMVDMINLEKKIEELEAFFFEVDSNPNNIDTTSTGAGVEYGLDCVAIMKKALISYKKKPANKHLKSLFYGFTAISRGVESFKDYDLEIRFREVFKGVYSLQENLQQNIKW
jgi:hypothetical protein